MNVGEDLGEMGESLLRHWCANWNHSNRAERDRTGWDYLLDFLPCPPRRRLGARQVPDLFNAWCK